MKLKLMEERLGDESRGMSSLNSISTSQKWDSLSHDLSPSGIFFGFESDRHRFLKRKCENERKKEKVREGFGKGF